MKRLHPTIKLMPRLKKGLTLIELLVVIAIIGILASLATFTYQDSQAKSRDSRRKADIDAIRKALELAKQDSAGGYAYPVCTGSVDNCQMSSNSSVVQGSTALAPTYIKNIPKDPKTDGAYRYYTYASDGTTACVSSCSRFKLTVCLENTKDPQSDTARGVTPDSNCAAGTASYTVFNL